MRSRVEAIVRLIVALVPAINIVLVYFGKSPLPFSQDEVNIGLSMVIQVLAVIWAWWKNNNMTPEAQQAQKLLDELKAASRLQDAQMHFDELIAARTAKTEEEAK